MLQSAGTLEGPDLAQAAHRTVVDKNVALGVSDVLPYPALAALMIFAILAFLGTTEMLRHGHNLRY